MPTKKWGTHHENEAPRYNFFVQSFIYKRQPKSSCLGTTSKSKGTFFSPSRIEDGVAFCCTIVLINSLEDLRIGKPGSVSHHVTILCCSTFVLPEVCVRKYCFHAPVADMFRHAMEFNLHLRMQCFHLSRVSCFKCKLCNLTFMTNDQLRNHLRVSVWLINAVELQ